MSNYLILFHLPVNGLRFSYSLCAAAKAYTHKLVFRPVQPDIFFIAMRLDYEWIKTNIKINFFVIIGHILRAGQF